ncbi:MAG TPA: O-antigen ligase family protein [Patescibacteria group bacterium]
MSSLENFCNKAIRYLFYLLFFFTPIVMYTGTSEVFEFNKMLFVYVITTLITAFWLTKSFSSKKFTIAKTPLDIPVLLFLLSQIISTFLSIDRHTSVWGYYSRFHGGLASTISYIVLFYAFVSNVAGDKKARREFLWAIIGSAVLVSVYGVLEHFGIDKDVWVQDVQNRVFSTLGQPNWLSAYLLAVLPLTVFMAFEAKNKKDLVINGVVSLLFLITILFTKSRSGIGVTFVILFVIFAIYLRKLFLNGFGRKGLGLLSAALILFVTLFLIGTPWTPNPADFAHANQYGGPIWPQAEKYLNKIHLTTQIKPVQLQLLSQTDKDNYDRLQQGLRVGGSDSMQIRSVVWQGAIELVKRYPFFGTGVDTFGYSYYWVRPASHNMLSEWDFLYNRAHNEYLNFAATTGLFGLLSYLFLIAGFIYAFIKAIKKDDLVSIGLLLGFISILITNFFGFSVVCIALFFYLYPAIAITGSDQFRLTSQKIKFNPGLGIFLVFCLTAYLLINTYHAWAADIDYSKGKNFLLYGPTYLTDSLKDLDQAISENPSEPLYKSQIAEAQGLAALYINEEMKALPASASATEVSHYQQGRDQYANAALQNANNAIAMNPYQTNYYKSKAKVALYLATYNAGYYNDVITSLLQVSEKAPTDAKVLYNLGLIYTNTGQYEEAKQVLNKAVELKPDYTEAITALAKLATPSATKK